jgi:mRNA-capping enzyme
MMLIDGENKIYMFDRNHHVYQISHLRFPKDAECTRHLTNTLVDGVSINLLFRRTTLSPMDFFAQELVIDDVQGTKVPRFLIYDIVTYEVR